MTTNDDAFGLAMTDLRGAASKLQDKTAPERSFGGPPEENGLRLATIARGEDEELRLSWSEYNGRNFLNVRIWKRREDGWRPEKGKGVTVRLRELADFAEGVAKAVDMASARP